MLKLENSIRGLSFSRVAFDLTIQDRKREDCSSKSDSATNDEMENSFFAIYTKHYEFYRSNNLGLKDLLWRMHKHRLNRWRRLAYRIFKPKKYIEEYKGIKLN